MFIKALQDVLPFLTLSLAVQCISAHSKKGVLLLVDELLKSTALATRIQLKHVVSQIGDCLDNFAPSQFNTVVTTLNNIAFKGETDSGRIILWIKLSPATLAESIWVFLNRHARAKVINDLPPPMRLLDLHLVLAAIGVRLLEALGNPILAQCISDCNGHFRNLESLKMLWDKPGSQRLSYLLLIRDLGQSIDHKYRNLDLPLLKAALRGVPVKPADIVPGTTTTYGEFIQHGYLLNTPGDPTSNPGASQAAQSDSTDTTISFVPRVSPLQLLLFANVNSKHKDQEVCHPCLFCFILTVSSGISICTSDIVHVKPRAEF